MGQIGGAFRRVRFALAWRTEPLTVILRPNHSSRRCFCGRCFGKPNVADPYRAYRAFRYRRARVRAKPLGCGFSRSVRKIHCVSRRRSNGFASLRSRYVPVFVLGSDRQANSGRLAA
jgi:hypothetical protein